MVGDATSRQVVLGCIGQQAEHPLESEVVSCVHPWLLLLLELPPQ